MNFDELLGTFFANAAGADAAGGDPPGRPRVVPMNEHPMKGRVQTSPAPQTSTKPANRTIPANSTAFSERERTVRQPMSPAAIIPPLQMPSENTGVVGTAAMPNMGRQVTRFGFGDQPFPKTAPGGAKTVASAIQEGKRAGEVALSPLDNLYEAYGESTPLILDALEKLAQVRTPDGSPYGGAMSAVDIRRPFILDFVPPSDLPNESTMGTQDDWSGEIRIRRDAYDEQLGHTVPHEVAHATTGWIDKNWPDNPYFQHLRDNAYTQRGQGDVPEYQFESVLRSILPKELDAVTGKKIEKFYFGQNPYLSQEGPYNGGAGFDHKSYPKQWDEHEARGIMLARELGYHPVLEAVKAGMFKDFDPQKFDTQRFEGLLNQGIDKLFNMYKQEEEEDALDRKTYYGQDPYYRMMLNTYNNTQIQKDWPSFQKGQKPMRRASEFYKNLLRNLYRNIASADTGANENLYA